MASLSRWLSTSKPAITEIPAFVLFSAGLAHLSAFFSLRLYLLEPVRRLSRLDLNFLLPLALLFAALCWWNRKLVWYVAKRFGKQLSVLGIAGAAILLYDTEPPAWRMQILPVVVASASLLYSWRDRHRRDASQRNSYDQPVTNPAEDCLGRAPFAGNLYRIASQSAFGPPRIVLTGEWGSGKTSVLNFVKWYAQQDGHPVVLFRPWLYRTRQESWTAFVRTVDLAIGKWRGHPIGPITGTAIPTQFVRFVLRALGTVTSTHSAGLLLARLIDARLSGTAEQTKKDVSHAIESELAGRRLIVLFDDLDRADSDIIYEVLLFIKEVIDIRPCAFLCAFDPAAVNRLLRRRGVREPDQFLDKIFQWSFSLPIPSATDRAELLNRTMDALRVSPARRDIIGSYEDLLPSNPRRLKVYLHQIVALETSFLHRFSDEDVSWNLLYLAELLKYDFPNTTAALVQDQGFLTWLAGASLRRDEHPDPNDPALAWRRHLQDNPPPPTQGGTARFDSIMERIERVCLGRPPERIWEHFNILSSPELLTWKEYGVRYREILGRGRRDDVVLNSLLDESQPIERRREFIRTLIRDRDRFLEAASDVSLGADVETNLAEALRRTEDAEFLASLDQLFDATPPLFDTTVVVEWIGKLRKWAHFDSPQFVQIRERERRIALEISRRSGRHLASSLLEAFRPGIADTIEVGPQFRDTLEAIRRELRTTLARQLVERFETPRGIADLWGEGIHTVEKEMLFNPNEYFHNPNVYERLGKLASRAAEETVIQDNFLNALRMLCHEAIGDGRSLDRNLAVRVLREDEFREILWNGATCRRLNRRTIGSLLEWRKKFIDAFDVADAFPVPQWVQREETDLLEHFRPAAASGQDDP